MRKITEVLRLKFAAGLSHEKIARAVGLSKGAVTKYVSLAEARGLSWPLPPELDEAALEVRLYPPRDGAHDRVEPDYGAMHTELRRKGVTLQLLWAEYVAEVGEGAYRYSQYCERYRRWVKRQKRSMRQVHRAGEKLFVDYCGPTVAVLEGAGGPGRAAQIFVAVLGASSYTYAEATWTQSLPDWIASHQRAFSFFGGVPELVIPDNLRAGVAKADRYAPEPNATYRELARHYGTAILPARPYKPKDKAKAEVGVQVVERWILARLRHRTFRSLGELNAAIAELLVALNERDFQKLPGSRRSLFERLERPALKALPEVPYEHAQWLRCRAGLDYHIQVGASAYSVPHSLAGQLLDVRLSGTGVEIFARAKRVAAHPRAAAGQTCTLPEHMPKAHREHREWSPQRSLDWAAPIGPATLALVERQLERQLHPEHAYRAWLGLRKAERSYGASRLESACERALAIGSPTYRSVASILKQGLDVQPALPAASEDSDEALPPHTNLRGSRYYH